MMNKLLSILLFSTLISFTTEAQKFFATLTKAVTATSTTYRGVGGYGNNLSSIASDISSYGHLGTAAAWKSFHIIDDWTDIETSDNHFDFTNLDAAITTVHNNGLAASVQVSVSPQGNYPNWLAAIVGEYTTTRGIYPKYLKAAWQDRFYRLQQTLANHFAGMGANKPEFYFLVNGTTGDEGPDHGNLTCCTTAPDSIGVPQNGDDNNWESHRIEQLNAMIAYMATAGNTYTRLSFNTANDFHNLDYTANVVAGGGGKDGFLSHHYQGDGYALYQQIAYVFTRGEVQNYDTWMYGQSTGTNCPCPNRGRKEAMEVSMTSVATRLSVLNTPSGYWTTLLQNSNDTRPVEFFNRYANDTDAFYSVHAFIHLGGMVGINDVNRYTEGTYGLLIPSGNVTAYNAAINNVSTHATYPPTAPPTGWGAAYKLTKKQGVLIKNTAVYPASNFTYVNNSRFTTLSTFSGISNQYGNTALDAKDWLNDVGFNTVDNWAKYITLTNSLSITNAYRGGSDTSIFGRFYKTGKDWTFDIENDWAGGCQSANVNVVVVYLDNNSTSWTFSADVGSGMAVQYTQSSMLNDGKWKVAQFTVSGMRFGTTDDFEIHSSANQSMTLIELGKQ